MFNMPIPSTLRAPRRLSDAGAAPMKDVIDFFSDLVRMDPNFGKATAGTDRAAARSLPFNIRAAGKSICVSLDEQGILPPMVHRVARSA